MKFFACLLGLGLCLSVPAVLAQANEGEKRSFSIGATEERPQFLPDSPSLTVPDNIKKLEAQAQQDPKNLDLKFDLIMAYSKTSLLDKSWPVALQIDKLDPSYTLKALKTSAEQIQKNPKDGEARYRAAMAAFARSLQLKENARDVYMAPYLSKQVKELPENWWPNFKTYLKTGDPAVGKLLDRPQVVAMLDDARAQRVYAEAQLQEILKLNPNEVWAKNYLAFLSFERGDVPQAERLIRESIATDPENPLSHLALGQLYLQQGKLKEFAAQMKVAFDLRAQGK